MKPNKNIHILSTDKPSRLHLIDDKLQITNEHKNSVCDTEVNIYITSDEEIKEGVDQWYIDKVLNEPYNSGGAQYSSKQDVIILTTDQDLIKDGIQPIDDEFLEWFVKNPRCESTVEYVRDDCYYEIIIPQEEPKQEELKFKNRQIGAAGFVANKIMENMINKFKQETLEEAKNNAWDNYEHVEGNLYSTSFKNGFEIGVKYQAERMYSEEEQLHLLNEYNEYLFSFIDKDEVGIGVEKEDVVKWFEQFKKK